MADNIRTTCCLVGGGPAGIMLGYLLARNGVSVTVLEKHRDFFRDFRGDTVHPSTLEVMYELGLLEELLQLPHQELTKVNAVVGDYAFTVMAVGVSVAAAILIRSVAKTKKSSLMLH
jgi:2-polyprenyl-6-methoxyphenol hydroxylase-like FAD-dependent oxidoreductase